MSTPQQPPVYEGVNFNPAFFEQPSASSAALLEYVDETFLQKIGNAISNADSTTFSGELISEAEFLASNNIIVGGTPSVNYVEFPDGTKQYTAPSGNAGDAVLSANQTFTGVNTFSQPIVGTIGNSTLADTSTNSNVSLTDGASIYYLTMGQNFSAGAKPLSISNGVLYNASQNLLYCLATNAQVSQNSTNSTNSTNSANVFVSQSAPSSTYYLAMAPSATAGNQSLVDNANLSYNTSSQIITGKITNASLADLATQATASTTALSSNTSSAITVTPETSSSADSYITFTNGTSGSQQVFIDNGAQPLKYNPLTSTLTCTNITGTITNTTTSATVNLTQTSANASYYVPFSLTNNASNNALYVSTLAYNPSTNVISATVNSATNALQSTFINATTTATNNAYPIPFSASVGNTSGYKGLAIDSVGGITWNPNSQTLTCQQLQGNALTATSCSTAVSSDKVNLFAPPPGTYGLVYAQSASPSYLSSSPASLTFNTLNNTLSCANFAGNASTSSSSGFATNALNLSLAQNTNTATMHVPFFVNSGTGYQQPQYNLNFNFNPGTSTLSVANLSGNSATSTVSSSSSLTSGGANDMYLVLAQNPTGNVALQTNLAKYNPTTTVLSAPKVSGSTSVTSPLLQTTGNGTLQILDTSLTNTTTMQQVGPKLTSTLTSGGEFFIKTQGAGTVPLSTLDAGTSVLWNVSSGRGESVLVNYQDNGSGGGFDFYNVSTGSNSTKIASIPVTQSAFSSTGLNIPTYNWVNGTISASNSASSATVAVTSDDSATVSYPVFSKGVGSAQQLYTDNTTSPMTYIASTGTLTLPNVVSSLTGNASSATQVLVTTAGSGPAQFLTFSASTGSNQSLQNNNALTYDPSTGRLTTPLITSSLTGNATLISTTNETASSTPQAILFASSGTGDNKTISSNSNFSIIPSTGAILNNISGASFSMGSTNSSITCLGTGTAINAQNASNINFTSALVTCANISATTNRNVGWTNGSNWFTVFDTGTTPAVEGVLTRFIFTTPSITGDSTQFGLATIGTDGIFSVTRTGAYDIDINFSHTGQGGTVPTLILGVYNTVGPTVVTNCGLTNFLTTQSNPFQYTVTNSFIGVLTAGQTYGIYYQVPTYAGALGNININLNMVKLM